MNTRLKNHNPTLQEILNFSEKANEYARKIILNGSTQINNNKLSKEYFNYLIQGIGEHNKDLLIQSGQYYEEMIGMRDACEQMRREKIANGQNSTLAAYEATIAASKKFSIGNCHELACHVLDYILNNAPQLSAELVEIAGGNHVVVIINKGKENAVIIDPLANSVFPYREHQDKLKTYSRATGFDLDLMSGEDFDQIKDKSKVQKPILIERIGRGGKKDSYEFWGLNKMADGKKEWQLTSLQLEKNELNELAELKLAELQKKELTNSISIFISDKCDTFEKLKKCHPEGILFGKNYTKPFNKNKHSFETYSLYDPDYLEKIFFTTSNIRHLKEADKNREKKMPEYWEKLIATYSDKLLKLIAILVQYNNDLEIEKNRLIEKYGETMQHKVDIIKIKQKEVESYIRTVNDKILLTDEIMIDPDITAAKYSFSRLLTEIYNDGIFVMRFSEEDCQELFGKFYNIMNIMGSKSDSQKNIENINHCVNESLKKSDLPGKLLISKSEYHYLVETLIPKLEQLSKSLPDDNNSMFLNTLRMFIKEISSNMNVGIDAYHVCSPLLQLWIKKIYRQVMELSINDKKELNKTDDLQSIIKFYFDLYTSVPIIEENKFIINLLADIHPEISEEMVNFSADYKNFPIQFDVQSFKYFCKKINENEIDNWLFLFESCKTAEQFGNELFSNRKYSGLYSQLFDSGLIYIPGVVQIDDQCFQTMIEAVQARKCSFSQSSLVNWATQFSNTPNQVKSDDCHTRKNYLDKK